MCVCVCRLLEKEREVANPYTVRKRGWNQVTPGDILLPQQPSIGFSSGRGVGPEIDEEGPDLLVPFSLLSGIALVSSAWLQKDARGRGRMGVGELREAMKELHAKASK